jgi:hypothetical protein
MVGAAARGRVLRHFAGKSPTSYRAVAALLRSFALVLLAAIRQHYDKRAAIAGAGAAQSRITCALAHCRRLKIRERLP